jgi:Domain of unknown function (DUF4349)
LFWSGIEKTSSLPKATDMERTFKARLKTVFLRLLAGFALFFLFRLTYGYYTTRENVGVMSFQEEGQNLRRNYASYKFSKKADFSPNQPPPPPSSGEQSQKYERVANVRSHTSRFSEDERGIKDKIRDFKGIVQHEKNQGNEGSRNLFLQIGIAPALFDSFYVIAQQFGIVVYKEATKTDMTSEFLQLNAKRASLEKTRAALLELKNRGGAIDEFVSLENNLLEIEKQLQELGVELGAYDEENEFCTVRFFLAEGKEQRIGLIQRVKVALEWTIEYYALFMLGLLFALAVAWLFLVVVEKGGILARMIERREN